MSTHEDVADDVAPAAAVPVPLAGGTQHELAEWEAATAAVLRKSRRLTDDAPDSDVWATLTTTTLDGIGITPLGTPAHTPHLPDPGLPGQAPFTRGTPALHATGAWDIRAQFGDPDAAATARHVHTDLENGANSLWLAIGPGEVAVADLASVLDGVYVDLAPVVLDAPTEMLGAATAFAAVLTDKGIHQAPGSSLGADPVGNALRGYGETDLAIAVETARIAGGLGAFSTTVDGSAAHDLGASDVEELAFVLASGVTYLRRLTDAGHTPEQAARLLEFRLAATDEQLPTIAKLRASRRLWARVLELSGVSPAARGQVQHAVTSRPMMTAYDPYVNLLRCTIAAFAAGVGGATSVTVLPFDEPLGLPVPFSRRIARNTSSLLIAESHVAAVTDPAGGAQAVEQLTDDLARHAWDLFQHLDGAGLTNNLDALRDRIAATAARRAEQVAVRSRPITGMTEFPNLHELVPERAAYSHNRPSPHRYAADFEELRQHRAETPVFLATMGSVAQHTARATFVANLFAAGGIDTVTAGPTNGPDDVVAAFALADEPPVVCLAGTDASYAEWGDDLVHALREAGARHVVIAGKPKALTEPVDGSAAMGVDALDFLRRTRQELSR